MESNQKLNETRTIKYKPINMISPVPSNDLWRQFRGTRSLWRWEGFVEKVGFESEVKE